MVGDIDAQNSSVNVLNKDIFSKVDIIFTIKLKIKFFKKLGQICLKFEGFYFPLNYKDKVIFIKKCLY